MAAPVAKGLSFDEQDWVRIAVSIGDIHEYFEVAWEPGF